MMTATEVLQLLVLAVLLVVTGALWLTVRRGKLAAEERASTDAQRAREAREGAEAELDSLRAAARLETEKALADVEVARAEVRDSRQALDREHEDLDARVQREREELAAVRQAQDRRDHRLDEREVRLDRDVKELERDRQDLAQREQRLSAAEAAHDSLERERTRELERVSGLTVVEARAELEAGLELEAKRHAVVIARQVEEEARREADTRAKHILVSAIQRLASEQTAESVVSTVDLPSDDMKGRIIGREGRNIRAFEQITGVNVMIDDTPGSVLLSCFDPVRRETARLALGELVADGRIHPARIEEVFEKSQARIAERCLRAGEDALAEVGIADLHPDLVPILGALRYRTSYGQNVLKHLIECAHLAGLMAAELGLDVAQCKRAAFLHDIGKALTHEIEGTHASIGANLARKYGEHPDIVHAIEAHHNEVEPHTVEAVLTQACDAMSGGRPGARRDSLESYVHRLERMEQIAAAHEGVEKVFAMQAGREVRVMVAPDQVDDIGAQVMARDIVKQIEEELTYPGQIRVTVVRESRATEMAR